MRFSIRWMLAVMAYVALVAAAMGTYSEVLIQLIWAIGLVAFCYAAVIAIVGRGRRQAVAVGFVLMFAIQCYLVMFDADRSPVNWLYLPAGYYVSSGVVYEVQSNPTLQAKWADSWFWNVRVVYAVATLLAGIVGCGVGALAWRNVNDERCNPDGRGAAG